MRFQNLAPDRRSVSCGFGPSAFSMNICIFCGSGAGNNSVYAEAARTMGTLISKTNSTLVYGGGNIGLMGIVADEVLSQGGNVIGVIPDFLMQKEVGHTGLTQLEVVGSMHDRKRRMADLADALAKEHGLPVLDGVSCAVGLAEAMVRLRILTSRVGGYSPPPANKLV